MCPQGLLAVPPLSPALGVLCSRSSVSGLKVLLHIPVSQSLRPTQPRVLPDVRVVFCFEQGGNSVMKGTSRVDC